MSKVREDPVVIAAIKAASQKAKSDVEFVRELNRAFTSEMHKAAARKDRSIRLQPMPAGSPQPRGTGSFHIRNDPRYAANAVELAKRTQGGLRVIGGAVVPATQFMDCVAVGNNAQWGCTGTLIAPDVVVTAGHCAEVATRVCFGGDVSSPKKVVKVKSAVQHPQYHQGRKNDLMVLVLAEKVRGVTPRAIATKAQVDSATDARVMGFGNTNAAGTFGYGIKRFVDIPIVSPSCSGKVNGVYDDDVSYGCDEQLEMVAGRPLLAQDSCTGDSGGPLYILKGANQWVLAGATSRATSSAVNNCGDGGVYVRIDKYLPWIKSIPGVKLP